MVYFYETWLPKKQVLLFCSECNKGFAHIGLLQGSKNGGKYGGAPTPPPLPHVGPLSCLESRKVFTEVLVMIYLYVKYCAADF